jgi:hypothetical protein
MSKWVGKCCLEILHKLLHNRLIVLYLGQCVCITSADARIIYLDCDNIPPPLPQPSLHSASISKYHHHYKHDYHSHNRYIYICRLKRTCNHYVTYGSSIGFQNGTGSLSFGYPAEGPSSGAATRGEANAGNAPVVAAVDPSPDPPPNPVIDPIADPSIGPPVDPPINPPTFPPLPSVPEPSTWVLMMLGFAGLGFVGYCRVKSSQASPLAA